MQIARTAGIFLGLAAVSFVLGFFVLSRVIPGTARPAQASTLPAGPTAQQESTDSAADRVDPPAASNRKQDDVKTPAPGLNPAAATTPKPAPGPSLDPSTDAPQGTDTGAVQKPRSVDKGAGTVDTQPAAASTASAAPKTGLTAAVPETTRPGSRRRRPVDRVPDLSAQPDNRDNTSVGESGTDRGEGASAQRRSGSGRSGSTTASGDETPATEPTASGDEQTGSLYHVHLGDFHTRDAADRYVQRAKDRGFDTQVVAISRGRRTLYRVQAGAFRDRSRAETLKQNMQDASLDAVMVEQRRQ